MPKKIIIDRLRKCPFCGNDDISVVGSLSEKYNQVICTQCGCRTPKGYYGHNSNFKLEDDKAKRFETGDESRAWVIEVWNHRPIGTARKIPNKTLKEAMQNFGITQQEFADYLGISAQTLYRRLRKQLPERDLKDMTYLLEKLNDERIYGE